MFDFLKKFKKECLNTCEQLEKAESQTKESAKEDHPIVAIIDGLLYDTSKAEKKFTFLTGNTVKSLLYCCYTDLYVTKSGRYFCEQYGSIIPVDERELRYLLQYYPKKYQEIFGKVEEA